MNSQRTDLFGENDPEKVYRVLTFADEIKPNPPHSHWAYLGIVSVAHENCNAAFERLWTDRQFVGYEFELGWSDIKPTGKKAKPSPKEELAVRWLDRLVNEHDFWRFSILGIDTERLNMSMFGDKRGDQIANAYRRFYRANLKNHVGQLHHEHEGVEIVKTYHDKEGRLEIDDWFSWHPQQVVAERSTVMFREGAVTYVDSCHKKEPTHKKASHFIQLCDVLIGATRYLFEDYAPNDARDRVVQHIHPLVTRLNSSNHFLNKNSRYKHVGRASMAFFPSRPLTESELTDPFARSRSTFFRDRQMLQQIRSSGQQGLSFNDEPE